MLNKNSVMRWTKEDNVIEINEITEIHHISTSGNLVIDNNSTNMFFIITSKKKLEDEIYDIASRFFMNWDSEIAYDGIMCGNHSKIEAKIIGLD